MSEMMQRTGLLVGEDGVRRLADASVVLCGVGAVGGYALEGLVRAGVGRIRVVDADVFEASNLNRQPFASLEALGRPKAEVTAGRLRQIAPTCAAQGEVARVAADNVAALLDRARPDAVVDAIDDVRAKIALLDACLRRGVPAWSAMGAARKRDPSALRVTDLAQTQVCPLARLVRQGLRALGHEGGVRCVWSNERPLPAQRDAPMGSYMPVTAAAGLFLAADAIAALTR